MNRYLQLAHMAWAILAGIFVLIAWVVRRILYKPTTIKFSLVHQLKRHMPLINRAYVTAIPNMLRFCALIVIACIVGQPQSVDEHSKIHTEGIAIMIVLDVSGSMTCFDDMQDRRSRFEVAKAEAIRFIEKRDNDQMGLIFFGKDAVSRCPLTLDKKILRECLQELQLGEIDPNGTVLSIATSMAVRRLKSSNAKTKVMILLTDGEPTQGIDIDPNIALELAQKEGIKIYTVGIGGQEGGFVMDPLFGIRAAQVKINKELLEFFAKKTGGQFFLAQKPQDMKRIYNVIDSLEKTSYESPIYRNYQELALPFCIAAFVLLILELLLTTFVWFVL